MKIPGRLLLLAVALFAPLAMASRPLEVIVFPGGVNWPLWVGNDKGFFAKQGIEVKITPTPNSVFQIENIIGGKFDIGFSTFDNVVAYDEEQGETKLAQPADLVSFMGALYGGLRLVVQPEIRSFADLKGKSLAVDAVNTGYALVLKKLLQMGGLAETDYRLESLGGTAARAQALMQNRTPGTILITPIDIVPLARGYRRLANAVDEIGPYQATTAIVRRAWAREHEKELVSFIRGYMEALAWLEDPAHRAEAEAMYTKHIPQANAEAAHNAWDALLGGKEGLQKDGRIDMEGAATVLRIRSEFGEPRKDLKDPSKYIDESYYRKAISSGRR